MKNIAYAGALAALLGMDTEIIRALLTEKYSRKPALMDSNRQAVDLGYDYAQGALRLSAADQARGDGQDEGLDPDRRQHRRWARLRLRRRDGRRLVSDHARDVADGSVQELLPEIPARPGDQAEQFAILQAEDEIAAVGMVIGASWAGARAFTSTAGPGISLMNEFIGLAYYAEVPAVIFDVQRAGPSTGMPTRTQQGDLMLCAYASHGDTRHICLYPADPREAFETAVAAFDLAERFQTPVFVLSDLDIGMNDWMVPKLTWDDSYRPDRGKVLSAEELEQAKTFSRYLDVDGDGIPYRTLPGVHPKGAYFTRGSGHNRYGAYTEDGDEYVDVLDRIDRKIQRAARFVPAPIVRTRRERRSGCSPSADATRPAPRRSTSWRARASRSTTCACAGSRSATRSRASSPSHDVTFVVEQNRDAQLRSLLMLETGIAPEKLESVRYYGGFPMSAHHVISGVKAKLEKAA